MEATNATSQNILPPRPTALPVIFEKIPAELKKNDHSVLWKYEYESSGKWTKPPFQPNGAYASSTDPGTWKPFEEIKAAYKSGGYDGIGFVLTEDLGIVGIDLDNCLDDSGITSESAARIIQSLDSYTEISPSGKGLRILVRGSIPENGRKKDNIEFYKHGRYLTITGNRIEDASSTIEDRHEEVQGIYSEVFGEDSTESGEGGHEEPELTKEAELRFWNLLEIDGAFANRFITPAPIGARSDREFHLCCSLCEHGFTKGEIYTLMTEHSPQQKWAERDDDYRWRVIDAAVEKVETREATEETEASNEQDGPTTMPYYTVSDIGSNYYVNEHRQTIRRGKDGDADSLVIPGFAVIAEELRDLKDNVSYKLDGYDAVRETSFSLTIPLADFFEAKKLKVALASKFDPRAMFHLKGRSGERAAERLENVIKQVTRPNSYRRITLVDRVMWHGDKLIVPSMVPDGYRIDIDPEKLPYSMPGDLDIDKAIKALGHILNANDSALPVVVAALGSPVIGRLFPNDRFGIMMSGVTGSGKTLFSRLILSMYGAGFKNDASMVRLGEGTTNNAARKVAELAGPMPVLFDNFKPTRAWSNSDLTALIHSVIEGSDKARLTEEVKLRETPPLYCTPIFTGEDYAVDTSTAARVMTVQWERGDMDELDKATTEMREHLPAIGREWLWWLQTEDGLAAMEYFKEQFPKKRLEMIRTMEMLGGLNSERIGSNLALMELSFEVMCSHPVLGPFFKQCQSRFNDNYGKLQEAIAAATIDGSEAEQFVTILQEKLSNGKIQDLSYNNPDVES